MYKNNFKQKYSHIDYKELLIEWGLAQYFDKFNEYNYYIVDNWKNITRNDLKNKIKMKGGHIRKFINLRDMYFIKYPYL